MNKWIDISQPLNEKLAQWPGDQPFHYHTSVTKESSGSVNIGEITTSTHIGTHVDAPYHFRNDGKRILDLDLDRYIGPCKVIDIGAIIGITARLLKHKLIVSAELLLIRIALPNVPERFPDELSPVPPDGADYMKDNGVKLVGVDTPSVDPISSKDLAGHHALHEHDIYILENVMLDGVEEGDYELIALPLPFEQADGSQVRAVIKRIKEG